MRPRWRRVRLVLALAALVLILPWCCGRLILWRLPEALAGVVGTGGRVEQGNTRSGYLESVTGWRLRWPGGLVVALDAQVYHGPLPLDGLRKGRPRIRPASVLGHALVEAPPLWRGLRTDLSGRLDWDGSIMFTFKGHDFHREATAGLAGVDLRGLELGYAGGMGGDSADVGLDLGIGFDRFALFQGARRLDLAGVSLQVHHRRTPEGPWDGLDLSVAALDYAFAGSGYGVTALVCRGQRTPRPAAVAFACGGQGPGREPIAGRLRADLPENDTFEGFVSWLNATDPLQRLRLQNLLVSQWVTKGGRVRVDDFILPTALGRVEGRLDLVLGAFALDAGNAWDHLRGRLSLALPRGLAEFWLRWGDGDRHTARRRLEALAGLGLIDLRDDRVILDLSLQDGILRVRDKSFPIAVVARLLTRLAPALR